MHKQGAVQAENQHNYSLPGMLGAVEKLLQGGCTWNLPITLLYKYSVKS
jgi:hypothetical protein